MLDKFSGYEFLATLFPGILFAIYIVDLYGIEPKINYNLISQAIVSIAIMYFFGVVISRIGSLVIEPIARKVGLVKWNNDYYEAEKENNKIITLLKDLNMYRNLISLLFLLILATIIKRCTSVSMSELEFFIRLIILAALFVLFTFSYRKQSLSINTRINNTRKENKNEKNGSI